jgi:3-phenylpropionate/cinnamic acid dioxygenase small subunit
MRADRDIHFEVEQFYFEEAELLDDGRYADWLELLAEDVDYWMPTRTNRLRRQQALSIAARGEAALYDETKESLAWRIRRFDSGMAWAEDPPSPTRHLVTNVVVRHVDPPECPGFASADLELRSAFLVYRNRLEREENIFAGPDQPGFGDSYRPTEEELGRQSITEIAVGALFEALDVIGIERFNLLGNSLGGAAAISMAQTQPSRGRVGPDGARWGMAAIRSHPHRRAKGDVPLLHRWRSVGEEDGQLHRPSAVWMQSSCGHACGRCCPTRRERS